MAAPSARTRLQTFRLAGTGASKLRPEAVDVARRAKQRVNGEPDREIQDHAHDRRRDRGQRAGQSFVAAKLFDVGSADEYP